jgi:hypothetical protein
MLDEAEYAIVAELYGRGFGPGQGDLDERFRPVREAYARLTGWKDMHHNAIMHHRIALYGPPCPICGKPYRTARASFCAACGHRRGAEANE